MPAPISWARGIIVEKVNTVLSRQYKKAEKSCFLFFSIAKLSFKGKQRNDPTEAERLGNVSTGTKVSTFSFRNWEGLKRSSHRQLTSPNKPRQEMGAINDFTLRQLLKF